MQDSDFFWDYIPFWIVNYGLSLIGWTCVGRFLLGLFVPPSAPNYIMRAFVLLSGPAVRATRAVTPSIVGDVLVPLLAAYWCFALRFVAYAIFYKLDMVPRLSR